MREIMTRIRGRDGRTYQCLVMATDEDSHIRLFSAGKRVGYLKSMQVGKVFLLGDIKVEQLGDSSLRRQGLGSLMLNLLIEHAHDQGCESITGNVMHDDLLETPGLLSWYEKRSFTIGNQRGQTTIRYTFV